MSLLHLRRLSSAPRLLSRSAPLLSRTPAPRSMASAASAAGAAAAPPAPTTRLTAVSSRIRDEYHRGPDVWSLFSPLVFPGATNLGQGFMSWAPPPFVRDALLSASGERVDTHHYSHAKGRPRLRAALAEYLGPSVHKPAPGAKDVPSDPSAPKLREGAEKLDVETEVQVTAGANGGIYAAMTAFLEPGDEVIMFEPFFDQYICEVTYLGGQPVFVPLQPPADAASRIAGADEWSVDWAALETAFESGKVKAMILNTPHNPIGKVFSRAELSRIAALAIKHDVLVISDEVYDCLTYDGHEHVRIAALEGMWERTLTVGSAGKSFACTGWRIGWLVGPAHLIKPALVAHTRIVFTCNSAASEAAAIGLEQASAHDFFPQQIAEYAERRALLTRMLDGLGITYTQPHGSYFVLADFARLRIPADFELPDEIKRRPRDFHMAWFVAKTCNVVTIPATAFVSDAHAHLYANYLRWSFCKGADEIAQATERLEKLRPYLE